MNAQVILRTLAVAAAVASLALIGFATLFSAPQQADAVIWDLASGERSNTARLIDVLDRLGHEEPRPFAVNGNKVWISTARSPKSPRDVLAEYQHALAVEGLNERSFRSVEAGGSERGRFSALSGGLVPTVVRNDYVAMGGVVPANDADTPAELAELVKLDDLERFKAFRSIEAFREPGSSWTTVVAVFSDESFDYSTMLPGKEGAGTYDPDVPACPGCVRLQRFDDLSATDHSATLFTTSAPRAEILSFYRNALNRRGWSQLDADSLSNVDEVLGAQSQLAAGRLVFTKDGRHAAVTLIPRGQGGTYVDVRLRQ